MLITLGLCCLALLHPAAPAQAGPFDSPQFLKHWMDGKAELSAYDLTFPRYAEARSGTAVTIFVTEPFSYSARVKPEPGKHPPGDEFQVMKLNLMQDFATGIYDYNLMTSVFTSLWPTQEIPAAAPVKIAFGAQEWCGQVYEQLLFDKDSIRRSRHSYFDGEGDVSDKLEYPAGGISEDALLQWARGMCRPFIDNGQTLWRVPVLRSLQTARLNHQAMQWGSAELTRSDLGKPVRISVPAGEFEVDVYTARISGFADERGGAPAAPRVWTIYVERDFPHRVIKWEKSDGERAELLGSARLEYWKMNGRRFTDALKEIGLRPRPPRTP